MLKGPVAAKAGLIVTRILVPLWILTGATFKLIAQTPSTLPRYTIFDPARNAGIDLGILLNVLIGLELLAVAVIVFMPRLARAMAGFMLGCFVLILINELYMGAENCGCFGGKISIHPGVMMAIDGALLVGVILFPLKRTEGGKLFGGIMPAAAATIVGFALTAGVMAMSQKGGTTIAPTPQASGGQQTNGPAADPRTVQPTQIDFPNFWYVKGDINAWVGQYWNQLELFQLMRGNWPADIHEGEKFIILYRRDCDHCEAMFYEDFTGKITTPILAYHIPVENPNWDLPPNHTAQLFDLSGELEWIITTPLVIKLVDGRVACAAEGEDFEPCLGVEPHNH